MAMEQVTVEYNGEKITLEVPEGTSDKDIQAFLQSQNVAGGTPTEEPTMLGTANAFLTSLSNSLLFGAPEYLNRNFNPFDPQAGLKYDMMRQTYPGASTAGDVLGLINPAKLGYKAAGKGIGMIGEKMLQRGGSEAGKEATMAALRNTGPTMVQQAGRYVLKPAAQTTGGLMAAQAGAASLGAARTPNAPGAGAQQGAQVFRSAAMNAPGTDLVPGARQAIGATTSVIPTALGYGSLASELAFPTKQYTDIDRQIREEAARRAMGQQ